MVQATQGSGTGLVPSVAWLLVAFAASSALGSVRRGPPEPVGTVEAGLLVKYFEAFLATNDDQAFERRVMARYTAQALSRLLDSRRPEVRQAAVLALGKVGGYDMNATVARALGDEDAAVRGLAEMALWSIWFRADSPENNASLRQVSDLIAVGRFREADASATRLIAKAPGFAEAYNQRAIARWKMGRLAESIEDCRRVIERNPYHIGALSGMGQCYWRLEQRREALDSFRQALKLQPRNENLREQIQALEQLVEEP